MGYIVTKKFRFEAAHRLFNYEGKCSNLHGHSYVGEISVRRTDKKEVLDNQDMVADFGAIKTIVEAWIYNYWDHAVLLNADDPMIEIISSLYIKENKQSRIFTFYDIKCDTEIGVNPTAEVMCRTLAEAVIERCNEVQLPWTVDKVRIYETESSFAEYSNV